MSGLAYALYPTYIALDQDKTATCLTTSKNARAVQDAGGFSVASNS